MRYPMTATSYYQNILIHHVVKIVTAHSVKMTRPYIQTFLFYENQTKSLDIPSKNWTLSHLIECQDWYDF